MPAPCGRSLAIPSLPLPYFLSLSVFVAYLLQFALLVSSNCPARSDCPQHAGTIDHRSSAPCDHKLGTICVQPFQCHSMMSCLFPSEERGALRVDGFREVLAYIFVAQEQPAATNAHTTTSLNSSSEPHESDKYALSCCVSSPSSSASTSSSQLASSAA